MNTSATLDDAQKWIDEWNRTHEEVCQYSAEEVAASLKSFYENIVKLASNGD